MVVICSYPLNSMMWSPSFELTFVPTKLAATHKRDLMLELELNFTVDQFVIGYLMSLCLTCTTEIQCSLIDLDLEAQLIDIKLINGFSIHCILL